jgi:integrase
MAGGKAMSLGTLRELAGRYIAHQRALGYKIQTESKQVIDFAEYAESRGHAGPITTQLALTWAQLPQPCKPRYAARRLEAVRCFARYAAIFEPSTEIPPTGLLGNAHPRVRPHIYSADQVSALIWAAGALEPKDGLRPRTYETLFGLLYCTGLRISEALQLCQCDTDLRQGLLVIRESKYHKSRLVPLHESAIAALQRYERIRSTRHPLPTSDTFFLSDKGKSLPYSTVRHAFRSILDVLELNVEGDRPRPRIYDLRHTFACHRLIRWYEEGIDLGCALTWLSTYMGHRKIADTYWYLTGVPELLQIAAARFERFALELEQEDVR